MDTTTFLWTLAATLTAGVQTFTGKIIAHEKRDAAFNGMFTYGLAAVIGAGILLVTRELPAQWLLVGAIGLASGAVHGWGNYLRIESLKFIDSVIFFPLNKIMGPVLAVLGGIFLFGDVLSPTQFVGIALSLTVPLLLVSALERGRQNNLRAGITYMFFSTSLTVVALLLAKEALMYGGTVAFLLLSSQGAGLIVSGYIYLRNNRNGSRNHMMSQRDLWLGFASGVLGFLAFSTLMKALSTGYVSLVYVIHAHYILIPIVLAVWLHKDHINARKLTAIIVSSFAIILLYGA